jgi:hypothetical protein
MRLVAGATLAALILSGCGAASGGGGGYRQGMPAACYAPKPDPTGYTSAMAGRGLNAGWYHTQAACAALSIRTAVYSDSPASDSNHV